MTNALSNLRHAAERVLAKLPDQDKIVLQGAVDEALLAELQEELQGIVLVMEGGVIQDVVTTVPMKLMVIDYDDDISPPEKITKVDQGDEDPPCDAIVSSWETEADPDYVLGRLIKFRETAGAEC